jgi:small-conductance mechanosensitive channel
MGELNNFFVSFGAITKDFLKGKKEVEDGLKAVDAAAKVQSKSMDQSGKQVEGALKATGNAAVAASGQTIDAIEEMRKRLKDAGEAIENLKEEMAQVEQMKKMQETIVDAHLAVRKFARDIQLLGTAITGAFSAIIYKAAEAGDNIVNLSRRTGMSVEELSKWGYVAKQAGTDLDTIITTTKRLVTAMDGAAKGGKNSRKPLPI